MASRDRMVVAAAENGRPQDELVPNLKWHKSVSRRISAAGAWGSDTDGWNAWVQHLSKRRRPRTLADRLPSHGSPLAWSLPAETLHPGTLLLIARLHDLGQKKKRALHPLAAELAPWLKSVAGAPPCVAHAAECLAWCHALPSLAQLVPADKWWQALDYLLNVAGTSDLEIESDPLAHQLTRGELPLSLAYLFPEIHACRRLASQARKSLSAGLDSLLDGEGLPAARHLELLRPLLACWTRSRALAAGLKHGCWDEPAQMQFEWVVRQAVRFSRADGTQTLCKSSAAVWEPELFDAALTVGGDADDVDIARVALPKRRKLPGRDRARLPGSEYQCEWAEVAMLRPHWQRGGPLLAVTWHDGVVRTELAVGRTLLWSGNWEFDLKLDGQPARPQSDWEVVCWDSDSDADYLELEISLDGGLSIQRQLLLTREDNLLLAADAVLAERSGRIEYQSTFPLGDEIEFQSAEKHHEGVLADRKPRARVLPLGLPEWRRAPADGALTCKDHELHIRQSTTARALYVPLVIDLDARRLSRPYTWRRLTVAEDRRIVPSETAVGYRLQLGSEQFLVYRSLAQTAGRTLLGHNLISEFLLARFQRDGEVEPLLEVE